MSDIWTYDAFVPGSELGRYQERYTAEHARQWLVLYAAMQPHGQSTGAVGAGVAVMLMMRAYLAVVTPRPPGNVHARQQFSLAAVPQPEELVESVVRCVSKTLRRERRYLELEVQGRGEAGRELYQGLLHLIWAR